jgi:hypothetical protein
MRTPTPHTSSASASSMSPCVPAYLLLVTAALPPPSLPPLVFIVADAQQLVAVVAVERRVVVFQHPGATTSASRAFACVFVVAAHLIVVAAHLVAVEHLAAVDGPPKVTTSAFLEF